MIEQIRRTLKSLTTEELEELKMYFGGLKEEIANDFKRQSNDDIENDEEKLFDALSSIISILGSEEIVKIIENIEEERKEEQGS